uniref:Uncharacterized protein n=1 Tax=Setaria italica TaxID=4555 RepID=K3ZZ16_SETIT
MGAERDSANGLQLKFSERGRGDQIRRGKLKYRRLASQFVQLKTLGNLEEKP